MVSGHLVETIRRPVPDRLVAFACWAIEKRFHLEWNAGCAIERIDKILRDCKRDLFEKKDFAGTANDGGLAQRDSRINQGLAKWLPPNR